MLSTQRAINSHLAALEPPEILVPGVIESVCEGLDWSFGGFWAPCEEDGEESLRVTALWHRPSPALESFAQSCRAVRFRRGEGLLGTIWKTREPAWLRDLQAVELPRSELAVPAGLRGVFAFPLALGECLPGILEFISEDEREPEPELVDAFQVVGLQLAQYLERWRTRRELREHEETARQVVDSLAEGVVVVDAAGRVTGFNGAAQRLLGFDPDTVLGRTGPITGARGMFFEDGSPITAANSPLREVLRTREPLLGVQLRVERDEGEAWFESNVHPLPNGGAVYTFVDVTERRRAERAMRASEIRKGAMLEAALDCVVTMDERGRVLEFNPVAEQTFGYTREEALGRELADLIVPRAFREAHRAGLRRYVQSGGRFGSEIVGRRTEMWGMRADGTEIPVELSVTRIVTDDEPIFTGFIRDLTERRHAEEEQRRLALIVESTDDAVLSKDRNRIIRSWNAGAERLYGYTAEEAIGRSVQMLVPKERCGEELEILDRVLQGDKVKQYETQRMRKDGTRVDVSLTVSPVLNSNGSVVGASVIGRDMTERKLSERALRAERDRAERYLDMAGSIIVALDSDERATMINRTGLEILGRAEPEVLGANWFDLVFPEDVREEVRAQFRMLIGAGVVDEASLGYYETPVVTSSGKRRTVAWMSTLLHEAPGHVIGVLSSGTDITERLQSEAAVTHLAYHDQLTGLANRALLEEHLEVALARASRDRHDVGLLYLDLDNFKMVNDSLGHAAGDRLLEMVAERLNEITRASDLVARHGGDEFLILLTDLEGGSVAVAEAVAGKILEALEDPFTIGEAEFEIRASVGIAIFPRDGETTSALLRSADSAMYQAKAAGRSRYAVHRLSARGERDLLSTTARLRRALMQDEFVLHYQPIFTVPDRRLTAVEALLRWNDPARGLVGPGHFIQLAEETGLIEPIGEWVIRAICDQALEWQETGLDVRIHFNLSPRQLRQRKAAHAIREAIEAGGVSPALLTAEITESAAMAEAEGGHSVLGELRQLGLHLSVDDFGSGYSSLARLRELPVDELKLDRSFLAGVPHDPEAGALVRGVIDLASGLGMDTVVEGVETSGQWNFLCAHGNLLAQGFHLARPAAPHEVTLMLQEARQTA